ncbi:hypothetical protein HDV01_002784 [Terramyces sp. JEL0728]|nr:hypothetical protein HDV01_002784 [Terramyces sp. JEL0728]
MNQNKQNPNIYSALGRMRQMHWKAQPRDTLLKPELHVSHLKTHPSKINECLYPDWWGHDEHIPERIKRKEIPTVPAVAKKLIDETTQTNSKIPVRKDSPVKKQALQPASQYINYGGGYQNVPIDFDALGNEDLENVENQEPFQASPIKNTTFVRKVKVPKRSETASKAEKEAKKEPLKNTVKESRSVVSKSADSLNKLSDILEKSTESDIKSLDTITGRATPLNVNSTFASQSPKKPPPPDGVYAIADAFLNGSLIQCLNLNIQDTNYDSISVGDINSFLQVELGK